MVWHGMVRDWVWYGMVGLVWLYRVYGMVCYYSEGIYIYIYMEDGWRGMCVYCVCVCGMEYHASK